MSWLAHIRSKPHHIKIRFVWGIAIGVAVILLIVWIIIGPMHINSGDSSFINTLSERIGNPATTKPQFLNTK